MIVVFGSINLDIVTHVARIPGPGETVIGPSYTRVPGGKGANQALAARRAGANVRLIGSTGFDEFADAALSLLRADGVDVTGVVRSSLPTGAAFISIDAAGQNAITVAGGANAAAKGDHVRDFTAGSVLLLQREVPDSEGEIAARTAKAAGARVMLNLAPSGAIPESYLDALDILLVNEHEAADLATALGLPDDHAGLARHLEERHAISTVVTLGAAGAVAWARGEEHRAPANPVTVVDTTAAGDTFAGAFAAALAAGSGFAEALPRGVAAGSLACTRHGAQPSIPWAAEIEAALASDP